VSIVPIMTVVCCQCHLPGAAFSYHHISTFHSCQSCFSVGLWSPWKNSSHSQKWKYGDMRRLHLAKWHWLITVMMSFWLKVSNPIQWVTPNVSPGKHLPMHKIGLPEEMMMMLIIVMMMMMCNDLMCT